MKKGFTLIELLAVIVILAIIALIAVPIVIGIIQDARDEASQRTAEMIAEEVKLSFIEYMWHSNANEIPASSCEFMNTYFNMDDLKSLNCENDVTTIVLTNNNEYVATYENGIITITGGINSIRVAIVTP